MIEISMSAMLWLAFPSVGKVPEASLPLALESLPVRVTETSAQSHEGNEEIVQSSPTVSENERILLRKGGMPNKSYCRVFSNSKSIFFFNCANSSNSKDRW